jgi:hypothetical protein
LTLILNFGKLGAADFFEIPGFVPDSTARFGGLFCFWGSSLRKS